MATFMLPFPDSAITGHFGKVRTIGGKKTSPHRGTDWGAKLGDPIPAVSSGTVSLIQYSKVLGWVLEHTVYGSDKKVRYVAYSHMDTKPAFKVGDKLVMGQIIGKIGTEGFSTGPHLHGTLSPSSKGVFYGTVLDLYKYLKVQIKSDAQDALKAKKIEKAKKIVEKVVPPVIQTKIVEKVIYACPHCKKELK